MFRPERFRDRTEAGRLLGEALRQRIDPGADFVVLALPRGGVPVGYEIARALNAPLDVFIVRKLGVPGQEELAMGAIASGGVRVINEEVLGFLQDISPEDIERVALREQAELLRREASYRGGRPPVSVAGRTVIVVDDGLATGSTMRAAVTALRAMGPRSLIVAAPVGAPSTCNRLRGEADEVVCLHTPEPFSAVGYWYEDFDQTTDEEVQALLERANRRAAEVRL